MTFSGEKLKILMALINQILTYVASRDLIDDNSEQLKQASYELRHHRWAEQRREKEEAAFWLVYTHLSTGRNL